MIKQLEPARAKTKKAEKFWGDEQWIAEEKLDGWRFLMHFGKDLDRTHLTGRRVSQVTGVFSEKGENVPQIWPTAIGELGYTVIDGEVMPPEGAGFRDLASIMNATQAVSQRSIAKLGIPQYHAFDLLFFDGQDMRHWDQVVRKQRLAEVLSAITAPHVRIVPSMPAELEHYERIVAQGGEGVILKDSESPYGEGWVKVKRFHLLDVVVTGFTDARMGRTGKYLGLIGAVKVSVYSSTGQLLEVGQVSGMTDDVRRDMSANPDKYLGTVMEVAAQGWGRDRLRHPRFKRHRPEAEPSSATFAKLLADLDADGKGNRQMSLL